MKKAIREGQPGTFRATFEDKILLSDIVFCRTWVPVEIKKYYNPVTSLLCKSGAEGWRAMKPKAQLHVETETPIEVNPDSIYKPIERKERTFNKLRVPKAVEASLPFSSKHKDEKKRRKKSYVAKRAVSDCSLCSVYIHYCSCNNFNVSRMHFISFAISPGKCFHGRPQTFIGSYYASLFM